MPVFSLGPSLIFPHPTLREPEGLLAVGGSLSPERLLLAYRWGIFPWYEDDQPILWWWTAPRLLLDPGKIHVSRSMQKVFRQHQYNLTINTAFEQVMQSCATIPRRGQGGNTWITPEMLDAYIELHRMGYAHSVEAWDPQDDQLVGGIYGVSMGRLFYGESMFSAKPNASKAAIIHLSRFLLEKGFNWIDCQQDSKHLRSLGAELVNEKKWLAILRANHLEMFETGTENRFL